jgi:hypothetical protein
LLEDAAQEISEPAQQAEAPRCLLARAVHAGALAYCVV